MDVFEIIFFIWIAVFIVITVSAVKAVRRKPAAVRSSDGHTVSKEEDLTCETTEGHHHTQASESEFGRRYIVHNEPETGYVVLNGVKRRLVDCKNL